MSVMTMAAGLVMIDGDRHTQALSVIKQQGASQHDGQ
jgi:hypothetical protein